jgi:hypothetical protein
MSDVSDSAHVRIFIADYAVADPVTGKITMVGGGIGVCNLNPATGSTAPLSVVAIADFDPKFIGESPAVELALETSEGQLITLPGQPGPLRVGVSEKLNPTQMPGADIPNHAARPKATILMQFMNGLPLAAGNGYRWRVTIDQVTHDEWTETIYVPTASAGPVLH